jgi:type II restriction enzyme
MNLFFNKKLADNYTSLSQKTRVLTEDWVDRQIYCPNCGNSVSNFENNRPVADFYCNNCKEEYELKSKKDNIGKKIVDGAYSKMIQRLQNRNNPNFFFLNYDLKKYQIVNFAVIPKHFFIPGIIEKRKALSKNARRAGWVGCNILLQSIPQSGKIFYVKNGKIESKGDVLEKWKKTLFLQEESQIDSKGWLLDTMKCIDMVNKKEFTLKEMYVFEEELRKKYPNNNFIKDKLRQQLQILRDRGYLEFVGRGIYRLN